jgi:hypothetical protein
MGHEAENGGLKEMPNGDDGSTDRGAAGGSGFLAGVEGFITYDLDDGAGIRFTIHFGKDVVGNSGDCS